MIKNSIVKLGLACAFCALVAAPTFALDTDALLKRLEATLNANNVTVKSGSKVTSEGSSIIIENLGLESASLEGADNLTVRLNDVTEGGDGSFTIGKFSVDDSSVEISGDRMDFAGFEIDQLYLPAESEPLYNNGYQPYKELKLKSFTLHADGKPVFHGGNSYAKVSQFEAGKSITYQGAVESFSFDVADLDAEQATALKGLGYENLAGKIAFTGGLNYEAGLFDIENFAFTIDKMGTLSLKLQLSGYTPEVAQALAEMQKIEDSQAGSMAVIGIGQKLNLNSVSLRFDDDSITNKLLDHTAETMGGARKEVISFATAMAQFGLANVQHPEFAALVSKEVESYLSDPSSIEVAAKPEQPLPFMMIFGLAESPKNLIDTLKVDVKANN